jgi:mannose-6-phosphate isomerase-like protein (cupin superfamily)/DNA-binding XRE family transcriptional regulator
VDPVDVQKSDPVDETSEDAVANLLRMMQASSMTSSTDIVTEKAAVTDSAAESSAEKVSDASAVIGPRLRAIRLRSGISLRELARRLELSPSSISQIETGKQQPSVRTLYALVSEFGVTVDEVLFDHASPSAEGGPTSATAPGGSGPGLAVQRAVGRPTIALKSGVTWERLMFWADEDVEFIEATYEPGGASGPSEDLVRHSGHEFGYLLSGTLRIVVGFDEFLLEAGDSITFPSSTPHRLSNEGSEPARAIWVVRGRKGTLPGAHGE